MTNVASREEMSESVWPVYDSGWFEDMDNNSSPTEMEPPTPPTPLLEAPEPAGGEASAENQEPAGGGSEPACGLGPSRCSIGGSAVSLSPESPFPSISEDEQVGSPGQGCPRFDRFDFVTNYGLRSIDSYD